MEVLITMSVITAVICAMMADTRNRSRGGWAVLGALFGIFAILALAIIGKRSK